MNSILAFLILCTVHTAVLGEHYKCNSCHGRDSENCEGEEILCPEGSACMTVSEEINILGYTFHSIFKRCALNLPCNKLSRTFVSSDNYMLLSTECCEGDLCNSGGFNMPYDNSEHLGPECPACFEINTLGGCEADIATICPGTDDKCLNLVGTVLKPDGVKADFSAQGCVSPDLSHSDYTSLAGLAFYSYNQNYYDPPATVV
ncbi:lymphocyte antigen 6 complex locus protein G6d-like [Hyperolius riggenbachi]|uniref:lymphocyte antigen 6 complex locus protein G6d-like n=1 Tax=Hyperolius riggenbachi TaxID=752182 RepID=UPI0035A268EE